MLQHLKFQYVFNGVGLVMLNPFYMQYKEFEVPYSFSPDIKLTQLDLSVDHIFQKRIQDPG